MKWDWIGRNVVTLTQAPKTESKPPPSFTQEQAKALLASFHGHSMEGLLTVLLGLGLRLGEVLGLRWEDVQLSEDGTGGTITIQVQLQKIEGEYRLVPPKSKTSRRGISLPPFVAKALVRERERQKEWEVLWTLDGTGNTLGLVFPTQNGTPRGERNVRRDFTVLLEKAGLTQIRMHDLRHLCASLLLSQGVPARVVMEILGHSQISLTMNTYSHVMPGATEAAAKAMQKLFDTES